MGGTQISSSEPRLPLHDEFADVPDALLHELLDALRLGRGRLRTERREVEVLIDGTVRLAVPGGVVAQRATHDETWAVIQETRLARLLSMGGPTVGERFADRPLWRAHRLRFLTDEGVDVQRLAPALVEVGGFTQQAKGSAGERGGLRSHSVEDLWPMAERIVAAGDWERPTLFVPDHSPAEVWSSHEGTVRVDYFQSYIVRGDGDVDLPLPDSWSHVGLRPDLGVFLGHATHCGPATIRVETLAGPPLVAAAEWQQVVQFGIAGKGSLGFYGWDDRVPAFVVPNGWPSDLQLRVHWKGLERDLWAVGSADADGNPNGTGGREEVLVQCWPGRPTPKRILRLHAVPPLSRSDVIWIPD